MTSKSILYTMESYLESVALSRSPNTARTYRNALSAFAITLESVGIDIEMQPASTATEDWIADFAQKLCPRKRAPVPNGRYRLVRIPGRRAFCRNKSSKASLDHSPSSEKTW